MKNSGILLTDTLSEMPVEICEKLLLQVKSVCKGKAKNSGKVAEYF
jgi:hypothetical protein